MTVLLNTYRALGLMLRLNQDWLMSLLAVAIALGTAVFIGTLGIF